jgi:hypothetical protein
MFSSKTEEFHFSIIFQYVAASFHYSSSLARRLFSLSLNRSFLRILRCGGALIIGDAVHTYSTIIWKLSIEPKRQIANSGACSVLIALVKRENTSIMKAAADAMNGLVAYRDGEDYATFIENGVFEELLKMFSPAPEPVTVDIPFAPETECHSEGFAALGCTWFPSHSPSSSVISAADYPPLGMSSRDLEILTVRSTKRSFSV